MADRLLEWKKDFSGMAKSDWDSGGGTLSDGQQAAFAVLAFADQQGAGGGIVVAMVEIGHLGAADAGGVEEFEHGAVAQAEGIGGVWLGEQAGDFVGTQGFR